MKPDEMKLGSMLESASREVDKQTKPTRKFHLFKIRLNKGGYTDRGSYFGTGLPLYRAEGEDCRDLLELRAGSRDSAKLNVIARFPNYNCTFYR